MANDVLKLIKLILPLAIPFALQALQDKINAIIHHGRFFRGELNLLADSLTASQLDIGILEGHEKLAFIPYGGLEKEGLAGIFRQIHGEVVDVTEDEVRIRDQEAVLYAYLVIATDCAQPPPAILKAFDRDEACAELSDMQSQIKDAQKIAVVGGGALGVELVIDIKDFYPEKEVTLVPSRDQLLPRFGRQLHDHVMTAMEKMGIEVVLNERPEISHQEGIDEFGVEKKGQRLMFKDEKTVAYDLIIPCTGQSPNTKILDSMASNVISNSTGLIQVQPSLQVKSNKEMLKNTFAIGDVADSNSPKMARGAYFQSRVVQQNVLALINGYHKLREYSQQRSIEGSLKLTLGKKDAVLYCQTDAGEEIVVTGSNGKEYLEVKKAWSMYGVGADIKGVKSDM